MQHRTCVNDDANLTQAQKDGLACIRCGTEADRMIPAGALPGHGQIFQCYPACADAETAQHACHWCRKTSRPLRRPAEQVRPLLEGNGAPVNGCDPCLQIVERGLAARGLELLTTAACKPWCVKHHTDPDGHTCLARPAVAPTEPGHDVGRVVMWFDSQLGHIINLACKVEDLTLEEAEQLLRALRTQVNRARSASR